jgi:Gpi18-like mannosyltransferase
MQKFLTLINFKVIGLFFLVYLGYYFYMPSFGFHTDAIVFGKWAEYALENGLGKIYRFGIDYLPLYTYVLWIYAKIQGTDFQVIKNLKYLLAFTLIFDMIGGYLVYLLVNKYLKNSLKSFGWSLFYVLNFMILYNTIFWGQIDGMVVCFVFAAFLCGYFGYFFWSCLLFLLALNLKLQAAIFLPIIGMLNLKIVIEKFDIKNLIFTTLALIAIELIIIFPFYQTHDLALVKNVIKNSFGKYPFVSYGAFNFWFLVGDFNVYTATVTHDSKLIWGVSMNRWGFLLFCFTSFFALFHLAKSYFLLIFKKIKLDFSLEKTLLSASLIPLIFFFFNTQMHERYSHPAFIFLVSYSILFRKFIPYITGSLAHFLSLEYIHRHYNLGIYDYFFFKTTFIACLYLFTIAYLFFQLFDGERFIRNYLEKKEYNQI